MLIPTLSFSGITIMSAMWCWDCPLVLHLLCLHSAPLLPPSHPLPSPQFAPVPRLEIQPLQTLLNRCGVHVCLHIPAAATGLSTFFPDSAPAIHLMPPSHCPISHSHCPIPHSGAAAALPGSASPTGRLQSGTATPRCRLHAHRVHPIKLQCAGQCHRATRGSRYEGISPYNKCSHSVPVP